VRNPKEVTVVADKIRRLFPDTRPVLRDEILRTYDSLFDWRSGLLLVIFAGAVAAFIIFAWDKATSLSLEERREMGVLKAVGWETSEVIAMKSWEGIVISLAAFLAGVLAAYLPPPLNVYADFLSGLEDFFSDMHKTMDLQSPYTPKGRALRAVMNQIDAGG